MYNKLQKTQFRKKKLDTITKNFLILPGFKESEKKLVPPPKKNISDSFLKWENFAIKKTPPFESFSTFK